MPDDTPIYSWPYPVGTDRVADGDNAIEDLALAIESTLSTALASGSSTTSISLGTNIVASNGGPTITRMGPLAVFRFNFNITGSISAGATIATVPAGWRPAQPCHGTIAVATSGIPVAIHLNADGTVTTLTNLAAATDVCGTVAYTIA